jgi:hypothetical protein
MRDLIIEAKRKPCAQCGIQYDWWIMQFDHVRGEKLFNISSYPGQSLSRVKAEIEKCEVVCANCHSDRTYRRYIANSLSAEYENSPDPKPAYVARWAG